VERRNAITDPWVAAAPYQEEAAIDDIDDF
jgi:hypothetical protein